MILILHYGYKGSGSDREKDHYDWWSIDGSVGLITNCLLSILTP